MRLDEVNIEAFEDYKESINVGPKAELEELCNVFNIYWGNTRWNPGNSERMVDGEPVIAFTPKLSLKRGTYDRIKAAYTDKVLRFNIRNSDMYNLANKIDDTRWRQRNFSRDLRKIQDKLWTLRSRGLHNLDDMEQIIPKLTILFNKIIDSKNKLLKMVDKFNKIKGNHHIVDDVQVFIHDDCKPDHHLTDMEVPIEELLERRIVTLLKLRVYIRFSKVIISVKDGTDRNTIGNLEVGPIEIVADYSLLKNLNDHWENLTEEFNPSFNGIKTVDFKGINSDPYFRRHPFISSNGNWVKEMNTCTSDFNNDLGKSVYNHDYQSYFLALSDWLGTFIINYTNPLNNINTSFHGEPKHLSENFFNIVGTRTCNIHYHSREEFSRNVKRLGAEDPFFQGDLNSYCNQCNLIDTCTIYKKHNPSEMYFQLLWNHAINYGINPYDALPLDNNGRIVSELSQLPEDEQATHVTEYMAHENFGNEERLLVYERVFHEIYNDSLMNELINDQYIKYLEHQKFMNREALSFSKHRFVNWSLTYEDIRDEMTDEIIDSFHNQRDEWTSIEEYEQDNNRDCDEDMHRAEMEEYMRNLMATGQVREAQPRRRT